MHCIGVRLQAGRESKDETFLDIVVAPVAKWLCEQCNSLTLVETLKIDITSLDPLNSLLSWLNRPSKQMCIIIDIPM